jgi:hypothetical protein
MTFRAAAPLQSSDETCSADSVSPPPKVLATFNDYSQMLLALRARAAERQIAISSDEANNVAGLSDGRLAQLLSLRTLHSTQGTRRFGALSLGPLLGILGVKLQMIEDPDAVKKYGSRLKARTGYQVRTGDIEIRFSRKFLKTNAKKGGRARMDQLRASQGLAEHQRNAALARWRKPKMQRIRKVLGCRRSQ